MFLTNTHIVFITCQTLLQAFYKCLTSLKSQNTTFYFLCFVRKKWMQSCFQGHNSSKWQGWDLNFIAEFVCLVLCCYLILMQIFQQSHSEKYPSKEYLHGPNKQPHKQMIPVNNIYLPVWEKE